MLGAVLLAVVLLFWSCGGGSDDNPGGDAGRKPGPGVPSPTAPADDITLNPSETTEAPPGGPPPAGGQPGGETSTPDPPAAGAPSGGAPAAPVAAGPCADAEIQVTPVPLPATAQRGQPVGLQLRIKNVSARTCSRDVGSDVQEIYIKQGAQKIWSSDTCSTTPQPATQSLAPNAELQFEITWNGRDASRCANTQAAGPVPPAGEYEVIGRLSARHSNPVKLVLRG